jgi:NtrC-family two-component system sensor histidine kinase KinB
MRVKTTLVASFAVFVLALLALGGWSAWRLHDLGGASRRIIADNYDSVVAAQNMKESLERQDSAALFILLGNDARAGAQIVEHRTRFDVGFERAARNITEPGERDIIESIRALRGEYYARFDALMRSDRVAPARDYFAQLEPLFNRLRSRVDDLLRLNQEAMRAKSRAAEQVARQWFTGTLALAGTLVVASLLLASALAQRIVRPLRALTAATERMSQGDLDVAASVSSKASEIQILATAFNRMADRLPLRSGRRYRRRRPRHAAEE